MSPDPTGGIAGNVMTYNLLGPPSLQTGDVSLSDLDGGDSDIIRFYQDTNGNSFLLFYSDIDLVPKDLADTGLPHSFFSPFKAVGDEVLGGNLYTPGAGDPGYVAGFDVTYRLISDVPEPSSLMLLGSGLASACGLLRRKLRK